MRRGHTSGRVLSIFTILHLPRAVFLRRPSAYMSRQTEARTVRRKRREFAKLLVLHRPLSGQGRRTLCGVLHRTPWLQVGATGGLSVCQVSNGNLSLLLSGPKASGSRPMPDGRKQEPGGWNRIVLAVDDLSARVEEMNKVGLGFRSMSE